MKERPILFSAPMVRALLAGTKSQTRRVVKPQPHSHPAMRAEPRGEARWIFMAYSDRPDYQFATGDFLRCPFGAEGGRLWVREAHATPEAGIVAYRANGECGAWMGDGDGGRVWIHHGWIHGATDGTQPGKWYGLGKYGGKWRPSIHMPRWASRITLEVTGVRVERLSALTDEDAIAEGARYFPDVPELRPHPYKMNPPLWSMFNPESTDECMHTAKMAFANGWDTINGKAGRRWADNPWCWVVSFRRVQP